MLSEKIEIEPAMTFAVCYHLNTLGDPMDFLNDGNKWLIDLYKDKTAKICIIKAVQVGVTEFLIVKLFTFMYNGKYVLYVLPTKDVRNSFVQNRIDPLIDQNSEGREIEFYVNGARGVDNTGLKHFWKGGVKFVGSNVLIDLKEFPAQAIMIDEYGECDIRKVQLAFDRVASARKLLRLQGKDEEPPIIIASNPGHEDEDIDREYKLSDAKTWNIRCDACRTWQTPDFFKNVVRQTDDNKYELKTGKAISHQHVSSLCSDTAGEDELFLCCNEKCNKPLNRLKQGEWIAKHPDRSMYYSGYAVSQMFTDQATMGEILIEFLKAQGDMTKMQRFHNSILGKTYVTDTNQLSFSTLKDCMDDYGMSLRENHTIAGIDVGDFFHIVVWKFEDNKAKVVYIGTAKEPEELIAIFRKYGVYRYAIDAQPEIRIAKRIKETVPGGLLVWIQGEGTKGSLQLDQSEISVNKTEFIDAYVANIYNGLIRYPREWNVVDGGDFVSHQLASKRKTTIRRINGVDRIVYVWDNKNKPDHYFLAMSLANKMAELVGFVNKSFEMIWV